MLEGGRTAWLETLKFCPELAFGSGDEEPRGLALVPVARLVKTASGYAKVPFAPPTLRLYPDSPLRGSALGILELLRVKSRELEEYKLSTGRDKGSDPGPCGRALAIALGIVLRHIARLHSLLSASSCHPWEVFSAASELASELGLFARAKAPDLRRYDHADPEPSFRRLRAEIAGLLEAVSLGPEVTLTFIRKGDAFSLKFPKLPEGDLCFWLSARTGLNPEEAREKVALQACMASPERLRIISLMGLPGVGLTPVRDAPAGLPKRADTVYFAVRMQDPLWDEALRTGALELNWKDAPEKTRLSLVAART
jgi:type VI secretion system protein ImpJ